jgi:hypothetical protein
VKLVGAHVLGEKDIQSWLMQRRILHMVLNGLVESDELADDCHNLGLLFADHVGQEQLSYRTTRTVSRTQAGFVSAARSSRLVRV